MRELTIHICCSHFEILLVLLTHIHQLGRSLETERWSSPGWSVAAPWIGSQGTSAYLVGSLLTFSTWCVTLIRFCNLLLKIYRKQPVPTEWYSNISVFYKLSLYRWPKDALIAVAKHFLESFDIKCHADTKEQVNTTYRTWQSCPLGSCMIF